MTTVAPAYLYQFGGVSIPGARGRFQWPAQARPSVVPTINGNFDAAGLSAADMQFPVALTYTGAVVNADTSVVADQLDVLRALTGTAARLSVWSMAENAARWAWARLVNVSPEMGATNRSVITFVLQFQVFSIWHGFAHGGGITNSYAHSTLFANGLWSDFDHATNIASSGDVVPLWNGGNTAVHDPGIIVQAGSAAITYLKLSLPSVAEWEYTGTIALGTYLVIDCGARTIRNDGADAFAAWQRTANHLTADWLTLAPGNSPLTVTFTGGDTDSSLLATYADGWA
jgi:hypothetical protein